MLNRITVHSLETFNIDKNSSINDILSGSRHFFKSIFNKKFINFFFTRKSIQIVTNVRNKAILASDSLFVIMRQRTVRVLFAIFVYKSMICWFVVIDVMGMYAGTASCRNDTMVAM